MTNLSGTNLNNGAAVGPKGEGMDSPSTFPKYPDYKDSGVEWLGAVPAHWVVTRLGRVTGIESGYPFPAEQFVDDGIPIARMSDLKEGTVSLDSIKRVEACFVPAKAMAKADDLLIGLSGSISNFAQVAASDLPLAVNQRVGIIRAKDAVEATIAKYFVLSKSFICQIESAVPETTILNISMEQVRSCALAWPPRFEQTQIARFLDHETARIDALIEEQQRLIELLKEKRQAVISHAVTKGLDPTVPMKDSGVEWLGEVPAHWARKRLKNISPFITVGIVVNPSDYVADEGLPFLYGGEVKEGFIEVDKARKISPEDSKKNRKTMLEAGDIVTMRVGYPGLTAVVPPECAGGNCASVMLVKRGNYDSHWLCAVMNSRLVRQQVEVVQYGAAQKQFNIADAIEFWMFEPPIEEQTMIAEFIDGQSSAFNTLMEESERSMLLLKERRSALISAAVTGKIDVRGWQPTASTQARESAVAEAV